MRISLDSGRPRTGLREWKILGVKKARGVSISIVFDLNESSSVAPAVIWSREPRVAAWRLESRLNFVFGEPVVKIVGKY